MLKKRAFTYTELLAVMVVAGIVVGASVKTSDESAQVQAEEFALRFDSDVKFASSLTVANPADPTVIKIDPPQNKYWLANSSAPDTPITNPKSRKPYIVKTGPNGDRGFEKVRIVGAGFGGDLVLKFDSFGGTDQMEPALVQIRAGSYERELTVSPIKTRVDVRTGLTQGVVADTTGRLQNTTNVVTQTVDIVTGTLGLTNGGSGNDDEDEGSGGLVGGILGGLGL